MQHRASGQHEGLVLQPKLRRPFEGRCGQLDDWAERGNGVNWNHKHKAWPSPIDATTNATPAYTIIAKGEP